MDIDMKCSDKRLSVHHIGGRGGGRAFPVLRRFEREVVNVLYDADANCLAEIQKEYEHFESELHVLPYCLGNACNATYFNINLNPYTSSLYDANHDYDSYYEFLSNHDELWAETAKTVEKRNIEMVTLDHIYQSTTAPTPPPNFLSIDTEGAEYDILMGAKKTLKSSVLAVYLEVWFHPFYKGQRLFGDLSNLLSSQGFDFVRFYNIHEASPFRAPLGLRGEGFQVSAEALFFRRIDDIAKTQDDTLKRYIMLRKLAFIAIIFNQLEFGLQCLHQSKALSSDNSFKEFTQITYGKFLNEFEEQVEMMPAVFPKTMVSHQTSQKNRVGLESNGRAEPDSPSMRGKLLRMASSKSPMLVLSRSFLNLYVSLRFKLKMYSRVEAVLASYHLEAQAKTILWKRVRQSLFK